jgi:hypothetical protein
LSGSSVDDLDDIDAGEKILDEGLRNQDGRRAGAPSHES